MKKIFFLTLMWGALVWCGVSLDIQQGTLKPFQLAVPSMEGDTAFTEKIRGVLVNDLRSSGFVQVVTKDAYVEEPSFLSIPQFESWRLINCRGILLAKVSVEGEHLTVQFKLWDVYGRARQLDFTLKTLTKDWRRLAHIMADKIYASITGDPGYFDTRIVYISETGFQKKRKKRLALMDQDGANHQYLTGGHMPVITPRFSPAEQKIVYVSYGEGAAKAKVHIWDFEKDTHDMLSDLPGITYAPRFSPDGQTIVMSQARNGNSHIYAVDLKYKKPRQLTKGLSIDTSPSFSPDGKKIVFNSDRGGRRQLYIMDADGDNIERISFGKGVYATPVWSPDGDWIAFTKIEEGRFYIGIMKKDGTEEQLIADGYFVEGPSWSPDGRMLTFYKHEFPSGNKNLARVSLYKIHRSGRFMHKIETPHEGSDPSWSPPLPFQQG